MGKDRKKKPTFVSQDTVIEQMIAFWQQRERESSLHGLVHAASHSRQYWITLVRANRKAVVSDQQPIAGN